MPLSRRSFFGRLAAAAAAAVAATETEMLDPERLLWTPGKKTIFLPPPKIIIKAEDAATAQIRERFAEQALVTPETRILRPGELGHGLDAVTYRGGPRYTLAVPDGRGGILQQQYNNDWSKAGTVTRRGWDRMSFEPNRQATQAEARQFQQYAETDWKKLDSDARIRTGPVYDIREDAHYENREQWRQAKLTPPDDEFTRRFKERS